LSSNRIAYKVLDSSLRFSISVWMTEATADVRLSRLKRCGKGSGVCVPPTSWVLCRKGYTIFAVTVRTLLATARDIHTFTHTNTHTHKHTHLTHTNTHNTTHTHTNTHKHHTHLTHTNTHKHTRTHTQTHT
jgi:hypothetical protein